MRNKETNKIVFKKGLKNEKDNVEDGRFIPLTDELSIYLQELFKKQEQMGFTSKYVFCDQSGNPIKESQYRSFLKRLCKKHNCEVTNNHAIRMNFNSYRLVNKGIKGPERAKVLGHSVTTNEKHCSFEDLEYCEIVREKLNEKD